MEGYENVGLGYEFVSCPIPKAKYGGQHEDGHESGPDELAAQLGRRLGQASSVTGTKTVVVKADRKPSA